MFCIRRVHCTHVDHRTQHAITHSGNDYLGDWYGFAGGSMKRCQFPTIYRGVRHEKCVEHSSAGERVQPWCMVSTYQRRNAVAICSKIVHRNLTGVIAGTYSYKDTASETCYNSTELSRTENLNAIFYSQLKTSRDCKLHCSSLFSCEGIFFIRRMRKCFLDIRGGVIFKYASYINITYYTRYICTTTSDKPYTIISNVDNTITTESSTSEIPIDTSSITALSITRSLANKNIVTDSSITVHQCVDKFTVTINTTASNGTPIHNATTVYLCEQRCLSFVTREDEDFCLGFSFDENRKPFRCFLHAIEDGFTVVNDALHIYLYTRHECITSGYYE